MTTPSCTSPVAGATPDAAVWPPVLFGQARIIDMAFRGHDLAPLITEFQTRAQKNPRDAAAVLDLASVLIVLRQREDGFSLQQHALALEQVFRQPVATAGASPLRVLMFVGAGDFMANIPVQFLLDGGNIALDLVYVRPDKPLPAQVPDHDVAIVGIAESDENRPLLDTLGTALAAWPKPVLINPGRVAALSRESLWKVLAGAPGLMVPPTVRFERAAVARMADDPQILGSAVAGTSYPIIVRPVGSHAGNGLKKIDSGEELHAYLADQPGDTFYVSPFVDYRNADGQFRKYRVAVVDGQPFACHLAIADRWMLHYLNAGMEESADKRTQEARWFDTFDHDFAVRHEDAFRALHQRLGLEYLVFDCAEAQGGQLLVFEADTAMVVHSMDSSNLFPYKGPQMRRVFKAFQNMLFAHASPPIV